MLFLVSEYRVSRGGLEAPPTVVFVEKLAVVEENSEYLAATKAGLVKLPWRPSDRVFFIQEAYLKDAGKSHIITCFQLESLPELAGPFSLFDI